MGRDSIVSAKVTMTKLIIAVNILIYVYLQIIGDPTDSIFMMEHGAFVADYVLEGEYYRIVSAVFLHFDLMHLFSNMLLLLFMGELLEKRLGMLRLVIFYLAAGVAGNLVTLFLDQYQDAFVVSAGASGAVFGVLGGLLFLLIAHHGRYDYLNVRSMLFFICYSLYNGHVSATVNNAAHIGGLVVGFLLMPLLCAVDFQKRNEYTE